MTAKSLLSSATIAVLVTTACTILLAIPTHAQTEEPDTLPPIGTGALDGRIYIGTTGIVGDPKTREEEKIVFQRGRFKSFAFEGAAGFTEAEYFTNKVETGYAFVAEAVNQKSGLMKWVGTVTDDSLQATAVWYRPNMDSVIVWSSCWIQKPFDPLNKPLDGREFSGTIGVEGDTATQTEEVSFFTGRFHSKSGDAFGFTDYTYHVNPRYDTLYFMSIIPGPDNTERRWRGWVFGDSIDAKIEWNRGRGNESQLLKFSGTATKEKSGK